MSSNCSSNLLSEDFSSNSSFNSNVSSCFDCLACLPIFTGFTLTMIVVILPLTIIILHLGFQRHREHRPTTNCDLITYHMVVMEMICVLESILYCIGAYLHHGRIMIVASQLFVITSCEQMLFHVFTCVECYLAVVHPITYLHLRQGRGLTVRHSIIWSVWVLGFMKTVYFTTQDDTDFVVLVYLGYQFLSLAVIFFCNVSVLRVLKQPGPGEKSRDRDRVDLSKQRSFYTIMAVMVTLVFRFGGSLVCVAIYTFSQMSLIVRCVIIDSSYWFCLPSSLVLPLIFLHKAGKLPLFNHK